MLKVQSRLAEAVREHSFNMGIALAESPQTFRMIALNLKRISVALNAVKHGRLDQAARALGTSPSATYYGTTFRGRKAIVGGNRKLVSEDISSMWLEIQYGWRPLINDVYEAMKAFEAKTAPPRKSVVVASTSRSVTDQYTTPGSLIFNTKKSKISIRVICELQEELSVARSLGLYNPAAILWEKVPWSFVVDWAIPIGTYLDVLGTIPHLSARFCSTYKVKTESHGVGTTDGYRDATVHCHSIELARRISTSLDVPLPRFQPLKKIASIGHTYNALALLHQARR